MKARNELLDLHNDIDFKALNDQKKIRNRVIISQEQRKEEWKDEEKKIFIICYFLKDKNYKEPPQTILSRKEINFIQNIIDDSNCSVETLANNLKNDKIILEDFCDKLNIKRQK